MTGRLEALGAARKLLRGFSGAPDPRRHAQTIYSGLARSEGWSAAEEAAILELGQWLQTRPGIGDLKPGFERLLAKLG